MLEGPAFISPRTSPSLPACVASPDPLPNAAEHTPDCSLHRRVSLINGAICGAKTAGIPPMVAGNESAAGDGAAGGLAGGCPRHAGRTRVGRGVRHSAMVRTMYGCHFWLVYSVSTPPNTPSIAQNASLHATVPQGTTGPEIGPGIR